MQEQIRKAQFLGGILDGNHVYVIVNDGRWSVNGINPDVLQGYRYLIDFHGDWYLVDETRIQEVGDE